MNDRNPKMILGSVATFFLLGCTPESIDFSTGEMKPKIVVKSDSEATYINAVLWHHKLAALYKTSDGEGFEATLAGETKGLTEEETTSYFNGSNYSLTITSSGNDEKSYSTKFEGNYDEQLVEVTLTRSGNHADGSSSVTIPLSSSILSPIDGREVVMDDVVDVSWAPSGVSDKVTLHFQSDCDKFSGSWRLTPSNYDVPVPIEEKNRRFTIDVPDTGTYSAAMLDVLQLSLAANGYVSMNELDCPVNIYITRKSVGSLGENLNHGSIVAENTRSALGAFKVAGSWNNRDDFEQGVDY